MFMHMGPYYTAQKNKTFGKTLAQFRPLRVKDVVTDGTSHFRVEEFVKFEGCTLVLVCCIASDDKNLVGRVGYRSMFFMLSKCSRSFLR